MKAELINVVKTYKEKCVLDGASCCFDGGKIYGLVGENGAGKSVVLKLLAGLAAPTEGQVLTGGEPAAARKTVTVGGLINEAGFVDYMSGLENLRYLAALEGGLTKSELEDAMRTVGLDPALRKGVGKYSFGMRQRLGIAQAVMKPHDIYLFDEPLNGIDAYSQETIRNVIKALRAEDRVVIITSHNEQDIAYLCDEVYEVKNGNIKPVDAYVRNSKGLPTL